MPPRVFGVINMTRFKMLIIDDEIEICLNMKEMLSFEGWEADYATTAKEAADKFNHIRYDLIFSDIKLEGRVSGIDIIKNFIGKGDRPKIVVISAIPKDALDASFRKEGISSLIDGFLDKPSCSNPEKLIQMARHVLQT